ncbi:MobF family relaxase [Corynebacterium bovis]|uniref:Conjugative relaxase-like TrwC/TraI family protein n=3 Tax=Corynebacterium bovis TaxID=36808 RepID=A0A8I0CLR2_9CORY|nr:MobF family relaxase [Corynebacterium bovis]MBB3116922.1 conjugative relaxase-like TrwC/TraI family protein [Corynebacterium bovis DSM 20582 = CIP 54.80]QQC48656.1 relaxase domain-containing protein [Corynebacterium bovis]WJY78618.1 Multifunctional conjugation protein TraI [Corynebacterium bovis DSM 20582 = CIP 54.80]
MMSLKVLHAGDGYSYLTRQVATGDQPRRRGELMADYYTAEGVPPGVWWGRGAAQLGVSGEVTEAQMRAAYGEFLHPDADDRLADLVADGISGEQALARVRLGRRPYDYNRDIRFLAECRSQIEDFTKVHGKVPGPEEREGIEQIVARRILAEQVAKETADGDLSPGSDGGVTGGADGEVRVDAEAGVDSTQVRRFIAEQKRQARYPVAGYDMVFTPAKSISVLWGIGDEETRQAIMRAHSEAVDDSLQWIEDHALFTRAGTDGVRKIDCDGATVARFVHWDNRAGDPNLHTHCALFNRVHCSDGVYRTVDGQVLHRAAVTASEHYNQRVTELVEAYLPVRFEARVTSRGARPVWEVAGVPDEMIAGFSRRDSVLARGRELVEEYRRRYGREPGKVAQIRLMEQANLETRGPKTPALSLEALNADWRARADGMSDEFDRASVLAAVLSGPEAGPEDGPDTGAGGGPGSGPGGGAGRVRRCRWGSVEAADEDGVVDAAVCALSSDRPTWTRFQVDSEVSRQLQRFSFDSPDHRAEVEARLVTRIVTGRCVTVDRAAGVLADAPASMCRADGTSVYVAAGSTRYTSQEVLDAEDALSEAAVTWRVNDNAVGQMRARVAELEAGGGFGLSADKQAFVEHLLCSPAQLAVGVGPAGTGKTTAMDVFARAWEAGPVVPDGRGGTRSPRVVGLAPSARAAEVLGESLGVEAFTIDTYTRARRVPEELASLGPGDVVVVDEAGMASTVNLAETVRRASEAGAFVRLVGDPQQLAAVEAGGMLGELAEATDAPVLSEVHRFSDPAEADASLRLRAGEVSVLDWYTARGRVRSGLREQLPGEVFDAWRDSTAAGRTSVMIAADRGTVDALNVLARRAFIDDGTVNPLAGEVGLSDGNRAAVGDVVVTRRNNRLIRYGHHGGKSVKNGEVWTVAAVGADGSLTVRAASGELVVLPAGYVADEVELGYATTVHRAQGMTVDDAFVVAAPGMSRQSLYVAMTRGRECNRVWVPDDVVPDLDRHTGINHIGELVAPSARQVLETIVARDGSDVTARAALANAAVGDDPESVRLAYRDLVESTGVQVVLAAARAATAEAAGVEQERRKDDARDAASLAEAEGLLAADPQTVRLARVVSALDAVEADTDRLLVESVAAAKHRWDSAEPDQRGSLAFMVRMELVDRHSAARSGAGADTGDGDEDLSWAVGACPPLQATGPLRDGVIDGETDRFCRKVYRVVQDGLHAAGDRAVEQQPGWTGLVGEHLPDRREYHAAWSTAVRRIAAVAEATGADPAELLGGIDANTGAGAGVGAAAEAAGQDEKRREQLHDRLDQALGGTLAGDQAAGRIVPALVRVATEHHRLGGESPMVGFAPSQIRAYIAECDAALRRIDGVSASGVSYAAVDPDKGLQDALSRPAVSRVEAEWNDTVATAGRINRAVALQRDRDAAAAEVAAAEDRLGQAVAAGRFTRHRDEKIATARRALEQARAGEQAARWRLSEVTRSLPPEREWLAVSSLAANDAQWQARLDHAARVDEEHIAVEQARAARRRAEKQLWTERRHVAEGLLVNHAPASRERRRELIARLRDEIAERRAAAGVVESAAADDAVDEGRGDSPTSSTPVDPVNSDGPAEDLAGSQISTGGHDGQDGQAGEGVGPRPGQPAAVNQDRIRSRRRRAERAARARAAVEKTAGSSGRPAGTRDDVPSDTPIDVLRGVIAGVQAHADTTDSATDTASTGSESRRPRPDRFTPAAGTGPALPTRTQEGPEL